MRVTTVVTIRPTRGLVPLNFRELWEYRELLYILIWRDIKVRYKQTAIGAAWVVIQPVVAMAVFSLFLGKLAGIPSGGAPYPVFVYSGLLLWQFFAKALTEASASLVMNERVVLVLTAPLFLLLAVLAALVGVGLWLSALDVEYRDVRYTLPFLTQLWFFATPIVYPSSLVPERCSPLYGLNPMVGVIDGFRAVVLGEKFSPDPGMRAVSVACWGRCCCSAGCARGAGISPAPI